MPDRWREARVRKVLRPAISIQVFLVSLCLLNKCWDVSPASKLSLHASHVALPKYILVSERLHVCYIRVINLCHRVPTQLQLNKYYYYYYYKTANLPIHILGPSPKGKYTNWCLFAFSSSLKRSGSNLSGSG